MLETYSKQVVLHGDFDMETNRNKLSKCQLCEGRDCCVSSSLLCFQCLEYSRSTISLCSMNGCTFGNNC